MKIKIRRLSLLRDYLKDSETCVHDPFKPASQDSEDDENDNNNKDNDDI